jgi:hypothetical protein
MNTIDLMMLDGVCGGAENGLLKRCQDGGYVERSTDRIWYHGTLPDGQVGAIRVAPDADLANICTTVVR